MSEGRPGRGDSERRRNVVLRELLDEVIQVARHLSHNAATMTPTDLAYARERLDWLAGEIYQQTTE